MTIIFPRPMFTAGGIVSRTFEIQRIDYQSPELSGRITSVTAGFPLWTATWKVSAGMSEAVSSQLLAWVSSLRGAQRQFYGQDYRRRLPLAYRDGLPGGFSGAASSWTEDGTGSVLNLSGFPVGFVLNPGDHIGFRWGSSPERRTLVRCLEAAVANGSGVITTTIEPSVPTVVPSGAVAYVNDASCIMRLTPDTKIGDEDLNGIASGSIAAIQDLRA